ncbi:MAG: TraB/GumN family protein [Rhodobacteraceae bacterium]|nr:TraB/GumN family protein [Paracoccaceae bacterium]
MLRTILTLLFCLTALSAHAKCRGVDIRPHLTSSQRMLLHQEAEQIPFNQGNHWIATRNSQTIHIVGTMHINDSRLNKIMRTLNPVIARADAILLEVSHAEAERFWKSAKEHKSLFFLPKGPNVRDLMSDTAWQSLTKAAVDRRLNMAELVKLKPWFLSMLLTGSSCGPKGMFATNGLDNRIEKQARRKRIPVGSLETVESAIKSLSLQPLSDQVSMLQFDLLETDSNDHGFITTREAYFDETMAEAIILEKWRFDRDFPGPRANRTRLWQQNQNGLLGRRNKNWMPIIHRTKGDLLIVAIGAAHLPGHDGLLNLLHKAGYTLQRTVF